LGEAECELISRKTLPRARPVDQNWPCSSCPVNGRCRNWA